MEPVYSIVIASRDEGTHLRRTIESLVASAPDAAFEIIVVDDASADGSADALASLPAARDRIRIVANASPRGLISSRARGADLAQGRYLAFLDAHCAVSPGWLESLAAALRAIDDKGIAVPAIHALDPETWSIDPSCAPGTAATVANPFLDFVWCEPRLVNGRPSTPVIAGGAWLCGRDWYRRIGGLDAGMVGWGAENIDIALRTWMAGGACVVSDGPAVGHLYRERAPRRGGPADLAYNRIRAAHNALERETFLVILKALRRLPRYLDAFRRIDAERDAIGRFKAEIERARRRPDRWLIETFRLPLLEPAFFYEAMTGDRGDLSRRPRPSVLIVIHSARDGASAASCAESVLRSTTYGNREVVVTERPMDAARSSDADCVAFLRADSRIADPHWIERMLLLFERHAEIALACGSAPDDPAGACAPHPVRACDGALLFVRREAFLALGGFDATRAWLAGYQVFRHPGVVVECGGRPARFDESWLAYKFGSEESAMGDVRAVEIALELRVVHPCGPGALSRILRILRDEGGALRAHLVYRLYDRSTLFAVCERPEEAALALRDAGFEVETETVVSIRTENRPGAVGHLVETLEAEGISIGYSYATAAGETLCVVLRTGDNPKAEDILRGYLNIADPPDSPPDA